MAPFIDKIGMQTANLGNLNNPQLQGNLKENKTNLFASTPIPTVELSAELKQKLQNIPIQQTQKKPLEIFAKRPTQNVETPSSRVNHLAVVANYFTKVKSNVNEYDAAINNALKHLPSKGDLNLIVKSNPRIAAILAEANLPVNMNYDNLKTIKHSHVSTTVQFARSIGKELGLSETELQTMETGAALHDIGKTLIPEEILNKKGKLTDDERKIVNLHSVLGYEILKSGGFSTNVAEIARDHHNPNSRNKYAQIVRAADVYSAMREERSYKKGKTHEEAMSVLRNMNINPQILAALEKNYGTKPNTVVSNPIAPVQLAAS